jgi:hypothetical protein
MLHPSHRADPGEAQSHDDLAEQRRAAEEALVKARRSARAPRLDATSQSALLDVLEACRLTLEYAHALKAPRAKLSQPDS